jgi:uncharacterized protein with von Willebrand factor type A (vWA) domain
MTTAHDIAVQSDAGETLVARITEFVRLARANDFLAGIGETIDAVRLAERCGALDVQRLRWGLRALVCGNVQDWQRFDQLFNAYWGLSRESRSSRVQAAPGSQPVGRDGQSTGKLGLPAEIHQARAGEDGDAGDGGTRSGASAQAATGHSDFRFLTAVDEMEKLERLVQRLAQHMRKALRRRWRLAREGRRLHLRHTLRHSLRYGGTPLEPMFSRRRRRLPRLILLLDVSRSMSLYSYFFLRFARGVIDAFSDAYAFAFHTHLVPISDALRERDSDRLKEKLAVISLGWAGGTRIGESLQAFNQDFARSLLNRRAVVIIISDGLDTGPASLLAEQLQDIKTRARRLIWLNPLLGRAGYEPLAAGMAAALPILDVFAPAHNLESLAALEPQLMKL